MTAIIIVVKSPAHFHPLRPFGLTLGMSRHMEQSCRHGMKNKKPCRCFPRVPKEGWKHRTGIPQRAKPQTTSDRTCAQRLQAIQPGEQCRGACTENLLLLPHAARRRCCRSRTMVTAIFHDGPFAEIIYHFWTNAGRCLGTARETNGPTTLQEQCKNNLYAINSSGCSPGQWTGPASRNVIPTSFRFISHIHLVKRLQNVFGKLGAKFWTVTVYHLSNWRSYCSCCQVAWA